MDDKYLTYIKNEKSVSAFVSSTFMDMKNERKALLTNVFPSVSRFCKERGVFFNEVDLQWGITQKEVENDQLLSVCFQRIDDCRPVFIGIIGDRYGSIAKEEEVALLSNRIPWLKEYKNQSITELEITYGVFKSKDIKQFIFFYFKNNPHPDQEDPKITLLKEKILEEEKKGILKVKVYDSVNNLEQLVKNDLLAMVEKLFPLNQAISSVERDHHDHDMFERNLVRGYVPRVEYIKKLDKKMEETANPIIIMGESGMGKSAFLANWSIRRKNDYSKDFVISHYIGANDSSTDFRSITLRMIDILKRKFQLEDSEEQFQNTKDWFETILYKASSRIDGYLIIVLDALNQLDDRFGGLDLAWLPHQFPSNVKIVISTLDGRVKEELDQRNWSKDPIILGTLSRKEKEEIVTTYLRLFGKNIETDLREKIVNHRLSGKPIHLKLILNEIRLTGNHSDLSRKLMNYLSSKDLVKLIRSIFKRMEADYNKKENLVENTLKLLYVSKKGLNEGEIRELLGYQNAPLLSSYWSPLYIALENFLITKSGVITISHDYIRSAVVEEYLPSEQDKINIHKILANYFQNQQYTWHTIEELPWHLARSHQYETLSLLLMNLEFFVPAWLLNSNEILHYWELLEKTTTYSKVEWFKALLLITKDLEGNTLLYLADFYHQSNHLLEALYLYKQAILNYHHDDEWERIIHCVNLVIHIEIELGDFDNALDVLMNAERYYVNNKSQFLYNKAKIHYHRKEYDVAISSLFSCIQICNDHILLLPLCYRLLGELYGLTYNYQESMFYYQKAEKMYFEQANLFELSKVLFNKARLFVKLNRLQETVVILKELISIGNKLDNQQIIANGFLELGYLHDIKNLHEKALAYFDDAYLIFQTIGDRTGMQKAIIETKRIINKSKRFKYMRYLLKVEEYSITMQDTSMQADINFIKANLFVDRHESNWTRRKIAYRSRKEAKKYAKRALSIYKKLNLKYDISRTQELLQNIEKKDEDW